MAFGPGKDMFESTQIIAENQFKMALVSKDWKDTDKVPSDHKFWYLLGLTVVGMIFAISAHYKSMSVSFSLISGINL